MKYVKSIVILVLVGVIVWLARGVREFKIVIERHDIFTIREAPPKPVKSKAPARSTTPTWD
jgi:hypothetical protein